MCVCIARAWCPAVPPCSHKDLAKDAAPHFRKAKKFYDALATEMVSHGHICDIFSCALDNVSPGCLPLPCSATPQCQAFTRAQAACALRHPWFVCASVVWYAEPSHMLVCA